MPLKDLLLGFEGRIRRRDWWIWSIGVSLAWTLTYTAIGGVLFGMAWARSQFDGGGVAGGWPTTAFGLVVFLPLLWVETALAAKRAHDRDKRALIVVGLTVLSGLVSFVPEIADLLVGASLTNPQFDTLATSVDIGTAAVDLYLLVVLGILDGTRGPNRFGRSPKGIGGGLPDQTAKVFS